MDEDFLELLTSGGVGASTLEVLRQEEVLCQSTFVLLHEEHFQRLLAKLTIGQHAVLTSLWQKAALEIDGTS